MLKNLLDKIHKLDSYIGNYNSNQSNLIFSFFSILSLSIFYYFSKDHGIHAYTFILLLGYLLFFININIINYRYIICISSIILLLSFFSEALFYILSITGYLLLILDLCLSKKIIFSLFWAIIFVIFYTLNFSFQGEGNVHYINDLLEFKSKDIDLYFHSSIASNFKEINSTTTGVHGLKSFSYWDVTNKICAKLSNIIKVRCIDFYSFMYPTLIMTLLLKYLSELVFYFISKNRNRLNNFEKIITIISILFSLSFLTANSHFGPVLFFFKWECYRQFSILFTFSLTLKFILVLLELKNIRRFYYLVTSTAIFSISYLYFICTSKYFFIYFALPSCFILCLLKTSKRFFYQNITIFISCCIVFFLILFLNFGDTLEVLEFVPFDMWTICTNETNALWFPFSLGLPLILLILFSNQKFYINNFLNFNILRTKEYIVFLILIVSFLISLTPTFFLGGPFRWSLLYPINTYYFFLSVPFALTVYRLLIQIDFRNLSINSLLLLLFIITSCVNTTGTGLSSFYNIYKYNKTTKSEQMKESRIVSLHKLCNTFQKLSKNKIKKSVLWVPKSNNLAWNLLEIDDYALPFVFCSLSELPLIYGFPNTDDKLLLKKGYGFSTYQGIPRNLDSDLDQSLIEAKKLGFEYLYVLESISKYTLYKL